MATEKPDDAVYLKKWVGLSINSYGSSPMRQAGLARAFPAWPKRCVEQAVLGGISSIQHPPRVDNVLMVEGGVTFYPARLEG